MMKPLAFTKMHGLGNDFVVIHSTTPINLSQVNIKQLADRHRGIGFDQLLVITPGKEADFFCHIYNADGSEAEQCGNGLRCVARFIHEEKLHPQTTFSIATKAGVYTLRVPSYEHIEASMGTPHIIAKLTKLALSNTEDIAVSILSTGNPHAIVKVAALDTLDIQPLGERLSTHTQFSQGANVGFMQIITPTHIRLRTFERGIGETAACGSNACAAAVAGILNGWLETYVQVEFRYGSVHINWPTPNSPITLTGPATRVFNGTI